MSNYKRKFVFFLAFIVFLGVFSCDLKNDFTYAENVMKGRDKYVAEEYEESEKYYDNALRIAREQNNLTNILITLGDMGRTCSAANKNEKAEEVFKERINLATKNNVDYATLHETQYALILFYLTKGKCQDAQKSYENLKITRNSIQTSEREKQAEEGLEDLFKFKNCN